MAGTPDVVAALNALRRHLDNPFLVLELDPGAGRAELEREGARILALLAAGVASASTYPTPFGPRERTADLVRSALAELRDPRRRLVHEWWARGLTNGASRATRGAAR